MGHQKVASNQFHEEKTKKGPRTADAPAYTDKEHELSHMEESARAHLHTAEPAAPKNKISLRSGVARAISASCPPVPVIGDSARLTIRRPDSPLFFGVSPF